jgi:F-type H+-transporting ATPase subunit a
MALIAFIVVEVSGMIALGPAGYLKTIFYLPHGLPTVMKPVMLVIMAPVEFLGKLTKPFALAVRLFANMTAGHVVIYSLVFIIFIMKSAAWAGMSVPFALFIYLLEILVAFLQAFIFTLLTALFIGMSAHPAH